MLMQKSYFGKTLCTLLLAAAASVNLFAQKKSSSIDPIARAGIGVSSSLNPIFLVGLGSEMQYRGNNFTIHGDIGMFVGGIPLRTYSKIFSANAEGHNLSYLEKLTTTPVVQSMIFFSDNSFSVGGGVVYAKKNCTIPLSAYMIPTQDNGYTTNVVGPCAAIGVNITNSFWCEATAYYIPESKGLSKTLAQTDRDFVAFSAGFIYELATENDRSHHYKSHHKSHHKHHH